MNFCLIISCLTSITTFIIIKMSYFSLHMSFAYFGVGTNAIGIINNTCKVCL